MSNLYKMSPLNRRPLKRENSQNSKGGIVEHINERLKHTNPRVLGRFFVLVIFMDKNAKKVIPFMRMQGKGYGEIGKELNMPKDAVKKFCKRYRLGGFPVEYRLNVEEAKRNGCACIFCGMPIKQPKVGRKRLYCGSTCREKFKYIKRGGQKTSRQHKK